MSNTYKEKRDIAIASIIAKYNKPEYEKHDYKLYMKRNAYDAYDLYVELPPDHPYFTTDFPEITKDFIIDGNPKFSKHNPNQAKSIFCKYYWYKGTHDDALEMLCAFANALYSLTLR